MRIVLIGADREENLATRYLAAALRRAEHEATLVGFSEAKDLERAVRTALAVGPDLIGLSIVFQRRAREFGALAQALRAGGFGGHLTAGGHFPTFAHDALLAAHPAIDSVIRHEGAL